MYCATTELPAGFKHETVVVAGQGVRATMRKWGDALLLAGGKPRPAWSRKDDTVLSKIGVSTQAIILGSIKRRKVVLKDCLRLQYWTDRGSYYYGHPDSRHPDWSMEDTLKATQASLKSQGVPIQYRLR